MFPPPTFPGLSVHQQTLHHVTSQAKLDVIVNNNVSSDEAYTEASTARKKTPVETRPTQVTPQHGNQGTEESPTKKLKLTLPSTPSEATKDNSALESTPIWANSFLPGGDVLCDILGENCDLSDPETA